MLTFTPQGFTKRLERIRKQARFAMSKAINETAKDFQKSQVRRQEKTFTVRKAGFVSRSVKIKPFATKQRLEAVVSIDPPGGQRTTDILSKFEQTSVKKPRDGRHLAVPVEARRTKRGVITKGQRPKAFQFKEVGQAVKGLKRTFIVPGVGIFQRTSKRRIRLLFAFVERVRIPGVLRFQENARKVVKRRFKKHFAKAYEFALRTAR